MKFKFILSVLVYTSVSNAMTGEIDCVRPLGDGGVPQHSLSSLDPRDTERPEVLARLPEWFPDDARKEVVAIAKPNPELFEHAFKKGMFPWREVVPGEVTWHSPDPRAIVDKDDFKIPDDLASWIVQNAEERLLQKVEGDIKAPKHYVLTIDRHFEGVLNGIATMPRTDEKGKLRPGQSLTWFYPIMQETYRQQYRLGRTHSVEVWDTETGELVAGLLASVNEAYPNGETMFHKTWYEDGVLKHLKYVSALAGIAHMTLILEAGYPFLDVQALKVGEGSLQNKIGGKYIPRDDFLRRIQESSEQPKQYNAPKGYFEVYFERHTLESALDRLPALSFPQQEFKNESERVKAESERKRKEEGRLKVARKMVGTPDKTRPVIIRY